MNAPLSLKSGRAARRALLLILTCAAICGCSKPPPQVEDGKYVKLVYQAKTIEGELVDANPDDGPIAFVVGRGKALPGVEKKLLGMKLGEERTFAVQDAYGAYDDLKTGTIVLSGLPDGTKVGDYVEMLDGIPSRIKEIRTDTAILDLNHPLAGKEIVFTVKVVDVKDAAPESDEG